METKKSFLESVRSIGTHSLVGYLGILVIGLLALNVGGYRNQTTTTILFGLLFALAVFLVLDKEGKEDKKKTKVLLLTLLPLGVFFLFSLCSLFWLSMGFGNVAINAISILGLIGAFLFGMEIKKDPKMPKHILLYTILCGLSLYCFMNLMASLSQYGFFYLIRYKDAVYFYDGVRYRIAEEMAIIDGFSLAFVSPYFGSLAPFVLGSSLLSLFFIKPKEEKVLFFFILIAGLIGFLSVLLVFNYYALIAFVPLLLITLLVRFLKGSERVPLWEKVAYFLCLLLVAVLVLFIMVTAAKGDNVYESSKALSKVFNNGKLLKGINRTINATFMDGLFSQRAFFGMPVYDIHGFKEIGSSAILSSSDWGNESLYWTSFNLHTFEFNALMETGILGFLGLCVFLSFLFPLLRRYIREGGDVKGSRYFFMMFVFSFFFYETFFCDSLPFKGVSNYVSPLTLNPLFLLVLASLGEAYSPSPSLLARFQKRKEETHA